MTTLGSWGLALKTYLHHCKLSDHPHSPIAPIARRQWFRVRSFAVPAARDLPGGRNYLGYPGTLGEFQKRNSNSIGHCAYVCICMYTRFLRGVIFLCAPIHFNTYFFINNGDFQSNLNEHLLADHWQSDVVAIWKKSQSFCVWHFMIDYFRFWFDIWVPFERLKTTGLSTGL